MSFSKPRFAMSNRMRPRGEFFRFEANERLPYGVSESEALKADISSERDSVSNVNKPKKPHHGAVEPKIKSANLRTNVAGTPIRGFSFQVF